jgi:hypothetical protein
MTFFDKNSNMITEGPMYDLLSGRIGKPFAMSRAAPDPVSRAQIRHWLEAMGHEHTTYLTEGRAPRAMMPVFTNRALRETVAADDDLSGVTTAIAGLGLLPAGVAISHNYLADIWVGDEIRETTQLESVSLRKKTRLGAGYFITARTDYTNQHDSPLGFQRMTVFAYPSYDGAAPEQNASPVPVAPPPAPSEGEVLPPLAIAMNRLRIIAACAACNDFGVGHYDPDVARQRGFEDIFTDIYTGVGLVHRFVTGWAGADAQVSEINLKLGTSFYAGDTLHLSGHALSREDGQKSAAVRGMCRTGMHLEGEVVLGGG